ncbi:MAG: mechanosensitive ion channel family protein [Bryobacteraceae bacterium]
MEFSFPPLETYYPLLRHLIRVLAIFIGAFIVNVVVRKFVRGLREYTLQVMLQHADGQSIGELEKRTNTITMIISRTTSTLIIAIAIVMSLKEIGFDIAPLLAGAGVVGLAVGFGAQNLVRDVISGMFMLVENQIRVHDVAIINGTGGLVEEINLRTTVLRSQDGTVHIFPNGAITSLSNMTREFSFYVFNVGVAYKENTDRVTEVLKEIGAEMQADENFKDFILEPLEVLGVDSFQDSAVNIRARIKTHPIRQWVVGREMNRRIKMRFDELGIEIPFPHRTLYFGEASKPFQIQNESNREELKKLIREVVQELRDGDGEKRQSADHSGQG